MKYCYRIIGVFIVSLSFLALVVGNLSAGEILINHKSTKLSKIPKSAIKRAKKKLHIAYGHTSHGSQLITGMKGLAKFKGNLYAFNNGGKNGALDIRDRAFSKSRHDLGHKGDIKWANLTRKYLNDKVNKDINVVIWSWCGGCSDNTEKGMAKYLSEMTKLENEFPKVKFVYMTGHLDGSGEKGNLHQRNEQIRKYCKLHKKILYDFADIESYDPDGNYYLDKGANDNCDYRAKSGKKKNWARDWQKSHTKNKDWFECKAAHSQPLNANLKAYACWWLWAKLGNSIKN